LGSFVTIARIVKTHGVKGEVSADLFTDFPKRFASLTQVRVSSGQEERWEEIESHRFHKGRVLLKFAGTDSPEAARRFVGFEVQIPESQRVSLPRGSFYYSDLIGCQVFEHGKPLGTVKAIFQSGAPSAHLSVEGLSGEEILIPMVRQFVRRVSTEKKRINVELPPGLLELAREEKRQSRSGAPSGKAAEAGDDIEEDRNRA
jgi:16S rRNA processing protein RimM